MLSEIVLRAQPDERLIQLAANGSEPAFEVIVRRYQRELTAYCSRLLLSDSRAEDATQQALMAAWNALRSGTEVRQLRPWLYRITHNQAMTLRRRPGWDFAELSESISGQGATPDADLERRMLMRETLAAVAALPDSQREAILRVAVEGDSYAEAAELMGVSETALRGLVHRARVSLRTSAAAIIPLPLVTWAAGLSRRHSGTLTTLTEALSNPATASTTAGLGASGAVAVKGAAVLAASVAVIGGTVAAPQLLSHPHHPARRPVAAVHTTAHAPSSSLSASAPSAGTAHEMAALGAQIHAGSLIARVGPMSSSSFTRSAPPRGSTSSRAGQTPGASFSAGAPGSQPQSLTGRSASGTAGRPTDEQPTTGGGVTTAPSQEAAGTAPSQSTQGRPQGSSASGHSGPDTPASGAQPTHQQSTAPSSGASTQNGQSSQSAPSTQQTTPSSQPAQSGQPTQSSTSSGQPQTGGSRTNTNTPSAVTNLPAATLAPQSGLQAPTATQP